MFYTNNDINFFLYVISGKKFRTDLVNLFRFKKNDDSLSSLSELRTQASSVEG